MALFICTTNCGSCEENNRCPMKGEMRSALEKQLEDLPEPIREIILNKIEDITPEKFLEDSMISVFNIIQSVKLVLETEGSINVSYIARLLEDAICRYRPQIKDDNLLFKEKIGALVLIIAQKIYDVLMDECSGECSRCFLAEGCRWQKARAI